MIAKYRLTKNPALLTDLVLDPGRPGTPGYWTTHKTRVCNLQVRGDGSSWFLCHDEFTKVWHPPTPAVPPVLKPATTEVMNYGWNAGGRSKQVIPGSMRVSWSFSPQSHYAVVGLSNSVPHSPNPATIFAGFACVQGKLEIWTGGLREELGEGLPALTDATVLSVERVQGVTRLYVDGDLVHTEAPNWSPATLSACLWASGDGVFNPVVEGLGAATMSFEPLLSGPAPMMFEPLQVQAGRFQGADLAFEPLAGAGGSRYGAAHLSFQPMTVVASYQNVPSSSGAALMLMPLGLTSIGTVGGIGGADLSLKPMVCMAGDAYSSAELTFAPFELTAYAYETHNHGFMHAGSLASSHIDLRVVRVNVEMIDAVAGTSTLATLSLPGGAIFTVVGAGDNMAVRGTMGAVMQALVDVHAGVPILTEAGEIWVVNDESGASSMYENYSYNSFGTYQGRYLGAASDGLYLLEGDTDEGDPVRASVDLGRKDFETTAAKTVTDCYIGVAGGHVWLKVIADGREFLYRTQRTSETLDTQRIRPGRGIKSNYFTFVLHNDGGSDFELANIEFRAASLSRRI